MMAGKIEPMSERAQALEAAIRKIRAHTSYNPAAGRAFLAELLASVERIADAALAAPPVGVSPESDKLQALYDATTRLLSHAPTGRLDKGATLGYHDAMLALTNMRDQLRRSNAVTHDESYWNSDKSPASLASVEPTPDAQVCVWREREWDYESGCRGTQISRDERSSGPPDGWKHCPYCGKRLEVGTAPQGGEQ